MSNKIHIKNWFQVSSTKICPLEVLMPKINLPNKFIKNTDRLYGTVYPKPVAQTKKLGAILNSLFLSKSTGSPSTNPVTSTFTIYPESYFLVLLISRAPSSLCLDYYNNLLIRLSDMILGHHPNLFNKATRVFFYRGRPKSL